MLAFNIKIHGDDLKGLGIEFDNLAERIADRIPIEVRNIVNESVPRGRLYRRGAIRGRRLKGLQRVGKTRAVVGNRFHRASAPGQPFASDTGAALRDIKFRRAGRGTFRVAFKDYVGYLEFTLNRPTVLPAVERAVKAVLSQ